MNERWVKLAEPQHRNLLGTAKNVRYESSFSVVRSTFTNTVLTIKLVA